MEVTNMNENNQRPDETPWDALTTESFEVAEDLLRFREQVAAQTMMQARKRQRRPFAGWALSYGAGVLSMALLIMLWPQVDSQEAPQTTLPALSETSPEPMQSGPARKAHQAEAFALAFSQSTPEEQSRLLREAGDRFLRQGDLKRATRYYGRMLDLSTGDGESPLETKDSWLLATLRINRWEEMNHEASSI
jgi:hypothetical protein